MLALAVAVALQAAPVDAPAFRVRVDSTRHAVVLTASALDIAGGSGVAHHQSAMHAHSVAPLFKFTWPVDGWARGATLRVLDRAGRPLPRALIHHINVVNFGRRQLFYPVPERLLAMGQETEDIKLPASVGIPVSTGMPMGVVIAFQNESHDAIKGVTVELSLDYSPSNLTPRPVSVLPAYMDVQNPVGRDVDFDLPAGRTSWSANFAMPINARIVGAGGHLHDYGEGIELADVTESARPKSVLKLATRLRKDGTLQGVERTLPGVTGDGLKLQQGRTYKMSAGYTNPTKATIPKGAMVHLILLIAPEKPEQWPRVVANDPDFKKDVARIEGKNAMPAGMNHEGMH